MSDLSLFWMVVLGGIAAVVLLAALAALLLDRARRAIDDMKFDMERL